MDAQRILLRHFLAAIAYRTQKALRGAPDSFAGFEACPNVRTPHDLIWHMTGVIGYARTFFHPGVWQPDRLDDFADEIRRFHLVLEDLGDLLARETPIRAISLEQLLQGPLADAMTHAGQLAMLRRLAGHPVPSENFIYAKIESANLGQDQAPPQRPILARGRICLHQRQVSDYPTTGIKNNRPELTNYEAGAGTVASI